MAHQDDKRVVRRNAILLALLAAAFYAAFVLAQYIRSQG